MKQLLTITLALACAASALRADDVAEAGRRVLDHNQNAVVTIKAVLKVSSSGAGSPSQQQEQRIEATGTVVDPSGLTALSYTTINPMSAYAARLRKMIAARGGNARDLEFNCEVTSAKLVLADGTEVPAEVALRDEDLDLAFLRPTAKPDKPMPSIPLTPSNTPQLLDQVLLLNRLGSVAKRALAISVGRIEAKIQKPRTFYSVNAAATASPLGAPVFALDGKFIGLVLVRKALGDDVPDVALAGAGAAGLLPVVIPAEELADSIKQALTAPKPVAPTPATRP